MGRKEPLAEAKVKCNGKIHKIVLTDKGQLVLVHHDKAERRQWLNLQTLGGSACRCLQIYKDWAEGKKGDDVFPDALQQHYNERKRPWRRYWYKLLQHLPIAKRPDLLISFEDYAGKQTANTRFEMRPQAAGRIAAALERVGFSTERNRYSKGYEYWVHLKSRPSQFFRDTFQMVISQNASTGYVCYSLPLSPWFGRVINIGEEWQLDLNPLFYEACFADWYHKFGKGRDLAVASEFSKLHSAKYFSGAGINNFSDTRGKVASQQKNIIRVLANWPITSPAVAKHVSEQLKRIFEALDARGLIQSY